MDDQRLPRVHTMKLAGQIRWELAVETTEYDYDKFAAHPFRVPDSIAGLEKEARSEELLCRI
jgi:hypothetical protein